MYMFTYISLVSQQTRKLFFPLPLSEITHTTTHTRSFSLPAFLFLVVVVSFGKEMGKCVGKGAETGGSPADSRGKNEERECRGKGIYVIRESVRIRTFSLLSVMCHVFKRIHISKYYIAYVCFCVCMCFLNGHIELRGSKMGAGTARAVECGLFFFNRESEPMGRNEEHWTEKLPLLPN